MTHVCFATLMLLFMTPATPQVSAAEQPAEAQQVGDAHPDVAEQGAVGEGADEKTHQTPPPSTYDLMQQESGGAARGADFDVDGRTFLGQIARTVLALFLVVGLIYVLAKVVAPRFLSSRLLGGAGGQLKMVERLSLDTRHSLYVVRWHDELLLVGRSDQGVNLVARRAASEPEVNNSEGEA